MSDDRQHEYVPPVARDILDGQRIAAVAAYAEAQRKAYNLQILYDDAMAMLSAMTAERDAARQSRKRLVQLVNYWHAEADEWQESYQFAGTVIARVRDSRDSLSAIVEKGEAERKLSQQLREDDKR